MFKYIVLYSGSQTDKNVVHSSNYTSVQCIVKVNFLILLKKKFEYIWNEQFQFKYLTIISISSEFTFGGCRLVVLVLMEAYLLIFLILRNSRYFLGWHPEKTFLAKVLYPNAIMF